MAARMQLDRIWKCAAIFFAVAIAGASSSVIIPSNVTLFTFTSPQASYGLMRTVVDVGATVTMRCVVSYNLTSRRSPPASLRKSYANASFHIATNDVIHDAFAAYNRFSGSIVDNEPNGTDIYEWTISNAQLGDTGNYTCFTQTANTSLTIALNVSAEPTQLSLYIDNELLNQSVSPSVNKRVLTVGQTYRLTCVVSGSNPFPNVTLTTGNEVLVPVSSITTTIRENMVDPVSPVTRNSTVSATWTMTNAYLGATIMCKAGVKNPNALSNGFIALADNALPNFKCPDEFNYDGKQTVISLTCMVASSELSSYYITWRNSTANMTVNGTRGVDIQARGDSRYVLRVDAPQDGEIWWTMKLTINNANAIRDLGKTTFRYVVMGSRGQAAHNVMIKDSTGTENVPGSVGRPEAYAIGHVAMLVSIAMATLFSRP